MKSVGAHFRTSARSGAPRRSSPPVVEMEKVRPLLGALRAGDRVLVVSASMGAGHDGAAKELRRRLERRGIEVDVVDYLGYLPAGTGWFVRWFYGKQLTVAPKSYDVLYSMIERFSFAQQVCRFYTGTAKRAMAKALGVRPYDLIVSTYPLASQTLGQLRDQGRVDTPLVTILTDFSVHTLWIHPQVDLHLALHPETAGLAKELGAPRVEVVEPLVPAKFRSLPSGRRALVRQRLGVAPGDRLALIVAGSWGVGNVIGTVRELIEVPGVTPVVVCGRNDDLRRKLADEAGCVPLGWVDWMPELVASSDVLIQNAGGMTCLEAFASGVPVISQNCIPGHGTANSVVLDKAGVALHGCTLPSLAAALEALTPERATALVANADGLFGHCPTEFMVDDDAAVIEPAPVLNAPRTPTRRRRPVHGHRRPAPVSGGGKPPARPHPVRRRVLQGSVAFAVATGVGLELVPAAAAAGMGVGLYHPQTDKADVYIAVRPSDSAAAYWESQLRSGKVTLAADSALFERPELVGAARAQGVPVMVLASGRLPHQAQAAAAANAVTHGGDLVAVADHHRIGARDQFKALWSDEQLIAPDHVIKATDFSLSLHGGEKILVDGRGMTRQQLHQVLVRLAADAKSAGLTEKPLSAASRSSSGSSTTSTPESG